MIAVGAPDVVRDDPAGRREPYLGHAVTSVGSRYCDGGDAGVTRHDAAPSAHRPLGAGYGAMAVVRDLDLHVDAGEVVALLGANGAGKTTTLLTIAGELPPLAGEVRLHGTKTTASMHARCRAGLSVLTEERSVFMELSTRDNLRLADVRPALAIELFPELEPLMQRTAGVLLRRRAADAVPAPAAGSVALDPPCR